MSVVQWLEQRLGRPVLISVSWNTLGDHEPVSVCLFHLSYRVAVKIKCGEQCTLPWGRAGWKHSRRSTYTKVIIPLWPTSKSYLVYFTSKTKEDKNCCYWIIYLYIFYLEVNISEMDAAFIFSAFMCKAAYKMIELIIHKT